MQEENSVSLEDDLISEEEMFAVLEMELKRTLLVQGKEEREFGPDSTLDLAHLVAMLPSIGWTPTEEEVLELSHMAKKGDKVLEIRDVLNMFRSKLRAIPDEDTLVEAFILAAEEGSYTQKELGVFLDELTGKTVSGDIKEIVKKAPVDSNGKVDMRLFARRNFTFRQ